MPDPTETLEPDVVLVVDDQPTNVTLLVHVLTAMGLRVLSAPDGPSALALLDAEPVDLILLDAVMPGMSGFEVARAVRGRRRDELLPILMVTALDAPEHLERAFAAGVNDFLHKPVNLAEVRARVGSFLRMRRQERTLAHALRAAGVLGEFQQDLASLLVHDLKGPLGTIRLLTQVIRDEVATAPVAVPGDLDAIELTCDKLTAMILRLIDISRMEQAAIVLARAPVDLGALARDALRTFEPAAAARGVALAVDAPDIPDANNAVTLDGDAELLGRVVANLVENAIANTPDHGAVSLSAGRDASGRCVLRVTNTGSTLALDERARIFEKYGRGGAQVPGVASRGLGLYFCRLAVEAHGGTIAVEGPAAGPITFVVTLTG